MLHRAKENETLFIRSMGKSLRVTAIATNDDDANACMSKPGNEDAVIAVFGPFILLANKYDKGV